MNTTFRAAPVQPEIALHESSALYCFDGQNLYFGQMNSRIPASVTACVPRSESKTQSYAGAAELEGVPFKAQASLTAMKGKIRPEAEQGTTNEHLVLTLCK